MLSPHVGSIHQYSLPQSLLTSTPVQDAVARHDMRALESLLKGNVQPDVLLESLEKACQDKSCPLAIKLALLSHRLADPRRALALAVRHDDIALAEEILKRGAHPERSHIEHGSDDMRVLLNRTRRRTLLYPPGADRSRDTALDHALQADDLKEAEALLRRETGGADVPQSWRDAVSNDRVDIQRAVLLLGMADRDRGFRLEQEPGMAIRDAGVREVMKEIPNQSPKHGKPQNLNLAAPGVACTHIAQFVRDAMAADPKDKSFLDKLKSKEAIEDNVRIPEEEIERRNSLTAEVHMVCSRMLGARLAEQFETMRKSGEDWRIIRVCTVNHAFIVQLRTRTNDAGRKMHDFDYVVHAHDPNATTTMVRSASAGLEAFTPLGLRNLIAADELQEDYLEGSEGVLLMYVHRPEEALQPGAGSPAAAAVAGRTLTSFDDTIKIDPAVTFMLLTGGFAGNLRSLKNHIASLETPEQLALLIARRADRHTGLFFALRLGYAAVIRAFAELLSLLPEDMRATPLDAATTSSGYPGLFVAMTGDLSESVAAFGDLLSLLPMSQRARLAAAKAANGTPGLHAALLAGHANTIRAFGRLLSLVPENQRMELAAAGTADGTPGLFQALQRGHADAVRAFGALLRLVPEAQRAEVLAARNGAGIPGLAIALAAGHTDAVRGFGELLPLIPEAQRKLLVAASIGNGVDNSTPGVVGAFISGHAETVRAYGELVKWVPEDQRAELLAARSFNAPALFFALANGRADTVVAFDSLLPLIPEAQRAHLYVDVIRTMTGAQYMATEAHRVNLLMATTWRPILDSALRNGYVEVIDEIPALLPLLAQDQRTALVLAVESADGESGLVNALRRGNAIAARAFGGLLLPMLPQPARAALLNKGAKVLGGAMMRGDTAVIDTYTDLCSEAAPGLSPQQKADLRKALRLNQKPRSSIAWCNFRHYDEWKRNHPASYKRFKALKAELRSQANG